MDPDLTSSQETVRHWKVSEYDKIIPQSQTADQPRAP